MATVFYICRKCGNVVLKCIDSGVDLVCCGSQMQELIPSTEDSVREKHLPEIECRRDGTIRVKVGSMQHPMTPEHYISFIYLETEHGGQIRYLTPDDAPEVIFDVCGDKPVAVYAYCNIHGLWMKDIEDPCKTHSCKVL